MARRKPQAPKGRPRLIGLCAWAPGSGKSTVAKYMAWRLGDAYQISFADPIRAMTKALLEAAGYDSSEAGEIVHGAELKEMPLELIPGSPSARYLMQTLGTQWGRMVVDRELWLGLAEQRTKNILENSEAAVVIFDDVRFENEYDMIHRLGGHVIGISRCEADQALAEKQTAVGAHASDAAPDLEKVDWIITNDLTLVDLRKQVDSLLTFGYCDNPGSRAQPLFEIPF